MKKAMYTQTDIHSFTIPLQYNTLQKLFQYSGYRFFLCLKCNSKFHLSIRMWN